MYNEWHNQLRHSSIDIRPFFGVIGALMTMAFVIGGEASAQSAQPRTILHCGSLIDPSQSNRALRERSVVIDEGRIKTLEAGFIELAAGDRVIDLRHAHCLPGLIDSHTHIGMNYYNPGVHMERVREPRAELTLRAVPYARTTLLAGITTVRDVGAWEGEDLALKRAIERGDIVGPRLFVAGHPISATGGHADHRAGFREDVFESLTPAQGVADGVPNVIHATRAAIRSGADLIKIMASGGVLSLADSASGPQYSLEELQAIVATAKDHGLKVTAHAHGDEGARRAVLAGVDAIEHGTYLSAETHALMKRRGVYLVPTAIAGEYIASKAKEPGYYTPAVASKATEVGPLMLDGLRRAYRAGVPIAFGSDAGAVPHGENAGELELLVRAGMSPMDAIKAATLNGAELLGQPDLGRLGPGARADVIAVSKDPLQDVAVLREVDFVMKDGIVFKEHGAPTAR